MDDAKTMLLRTKEPVSAIASDVGYFSLNTFYRVFKKMEGVTPSHYRDLYNGN